MNLTWNAHGAGQQGDVQLSFYASSQFYSQ